MDRRVAHTGEQNDTLWCGDTGGCDGHMENQDRRRVLFLHCFDKKVDRFGHFGAKWRPTLFLTPHVRSLTLQFEVSSTQVYQMLICEQVNRLVVHECVANDVCVNDMNRTATHAHAQNGACWRPESDCRPRACTK